MATLPQPLPRRHCCGTNPFWASPHSQCLLRRSILPFEHTHRHTTPSRHTGILLLTYKSARHLHRCTLNATAVTRIFFLQAASVQLKQTADARQSALKGPPFAYLNVVTIKLPVPPFVKENLVQLPIQPRRQTNMSP